MKKAKFVTTIGSLALAASMLMAGCSAVSSVSADRDDGPAAEEAEEAEEESSENATEEETSDRPAAADTEAGAEEAPKEPEEQAQGNTAGGAIAPGSLATTYGATGGALEGQLEYMNQLPPMDMIDYESMPEDITLHDLDLIYDEDIRALAQQMADEGYTIEDPKMDVTFGFGLPNDGEYIFNNGFYAYIDGDDLLQCYSACKMNEELFNYFLVGYFRSEDAAVTDDGTVIRYSSGADYVEYNRDTGIGICYTEDDMTFGVG